MLKVILRFVGNVTMVIWIIMFLFVTTVMKRNADSNLPSLNMKNLTDRTALIKTFVFYFAAIWAQSLCFTGLAIGMRMRNLAVSERTYLFHGKKTLCWLWVLFHFLIVPANFVSFKNIGEGGEVVHFLACVALLGLFCVTLFSKKASHH